MSARRAYDLLRGYLNREWDRIKGIEWDPEEPEAEVAPSIVLPEQGDLPAPRKQDSKETARILLGVSEESSFEEIRKSFERLNERSDPSRFVEGSSEQIQARNIRIRVQWAYTILTEHFTPSEKRFKSLELD